MDERIFQELYGQLVLVDLIGSSQTRELVFYDPSDRSLKIFIYPEQNHKRPHIHIEWKKQHKLSVSILEREVLIGEMPLKYLKPIREWAEKNEKELLQAWKDIQDGKKPDLTWSK